MKHLDLFSGIGGFALAADRVWPGIEHTFVEYDSFCQAILKKHYPNSQIHGDIRTFIAESAANANSQRERDGLGSVQKEDGEVSERHEHAKLSDSKRLLYEQVHILTGGFPCQPFSHAGRRKGTDDDRYLWPEMFRVVQLYKPTWVIAENVRGLTTWNEGMVLETVCTDLESEGYEVQPFIIPACAVGAPHRRERVWIVAHTRCERREPRAEQDIRPESEEPEWENDSIRSNEWNRDWSEVALATCHDRVDDGLPRQMDGVTISGSRHRKKRLKACGNAIVPQEAEMMMRSILSNH